eukprot:m.2194 g.2194  ORF g.2194 m.2194 type:complete len:60 (+) comp1389_c0_seq1:149-328(+)
MVFLLRLLVIIALVCCHCSRLQSMLSFALIALVCCHGSRLLLMHPMFRKFAILLLFVCC